MREYSSSPPIVKPKHFLDTLTARSLFLVFALLGGLVWGYFQTRGVNTYDPWFNPPWRLPLWFPYLPGFASALLSLAVTKRSSTRLWMSGVAGSLTWIGIASWWFPIAEREDDASNAYCMHNYCHVSGVEGFGLLLYVLFGIALMWFSALVITLVVSILIGIVTFLRKEFL